MICVLLAGFARVQAQCFNPYQYCMSHDVGLTLSGKRTGQKFAQALAAYNRVLPILHGINAQRTDFNMPTAGDFIPELETFKGRGCSLVEGMSLVWHMFNADLRQGSNLSAGVANFFVFSEGRENYVLVAYYDGRRWFTAMFDNDDIGDIKAFLQSFGATGLIHPTIISKY